MKNNQNRRKNAKSSDREVVFFLKYRRSMLQLKGIIVRIMGLFLQKLLRVLKYEISRFSLC